MKTIKKLLFLLPYVLIALVPVLFSFGGIFYWIGPIIVFGIVPLLDLIIGKDPINPPEEEVPALEKQNYFKILTMVYVPVQYALIAWGAYILITDTTLATYEMAGLMTTVGILTGAFGITIAHELGHKNTKSEKTLAQALLCSVSYAHFFIEHNLGHHVNVSTPMDPASSKFNQTFYRYYPQTVGGSFRHAWNLEKKRLERKKFSLFGTKNRMLWYMFWPLVMAASLGSMGFIFTGSFSWLAAGYFFVQSWVAFSLLEVVNYIEHYGLRRKEIKPGKYEKVNELHSWNANEFLTNAFVFHLQRHSDHHANETRRYQSLRHFEQSPQLPTGYAGMILVALVPPLWFKIMNPRVMAFYGGRPPYFADKDAKPYLKAA